MAQYYPDRPAEDIRLHIKTEYLNTLDIEGFSHMMKDPSYCYKFFWLEAIVRLISEGVEQTTFDGIIDEMIANAWYSVREYHIHLSGMQADGEVRDGLERAVLLLAQLSGLEANASKVEIKNAVRAFARELKTCKTQLTNMVPYRALAGFFAGSDEPAHWDSAVRMTEYIRRVNEEVTVLPYVLGTGSRLRKEVYFHPDWIRMIQDNMVAILGWIQYEKMRWLQNNNPEVPGLVYKLAPMDEKIRKLAKVRGLWEGVLECTQIRDVFNDEIIVSRQYELDHFIPWSFVMNDELWNLMPLQPSLNSSKSNRLPRWEPFFRRFAENQFLMYELIHAQPALHRQFEQCYKDNLHSIWAGQELYRPGNSKEAFCNILEQNMKPVYDSARRQGYDIWQI